MEVIIETPKGSRNKFKYEPKTQKLKLSKVLPQGMIFPYDFGYVPSTKGEDGDPLDILVLMDEPTFPGCLLECRLIGIVEAEQTEEGETQRNDRLIGVAQQSLVYSDIRKIGDLKPIILKQIEAFLLNYPRVEGREVKLLGRKGPDGALKLVRAASIHKHAV